ncbi:hypothetical protein Tcan_01444, partial [Toxocara canis]
MTSTNGIRQAMFRVAQKLQSTSMGPQTRHIMHNHCVHAPNQASLLHIRPPSSHHQHSCFYSQLAHPQYLFLNISISTTSSCTYSYWSESAPGGRRTRRKSAAGGKVISILLALRGKLVVLIAIRHEGKQRRQPVGLDALCFTRDQWVASRADSCKS